MIRKTVEGREYESQMIGELHFDKEPKEGSFNPVTSDGIFRALENCSNLDDKFKVIAAAFNELNARVSAIEATLANVNIGSVIADSVDTQKLSVGGVDINTIIQNTIGG